MVEEFPQPGAQYIDERGVRFQNEYPHGWTQFSVRHLVGTMLMTGFLSGGAKIIANEIERDQAANHRITAKESGYLPA